MRNARSRESTSGVLILTNTHTRDRKGYPNLECYIPTIRYFIKIIKTRLSDIGVSRKEHYQQQITWRLGDWPAALRVCAIPNYHATPEKKKRTLPQIRFFRIQHPAASTVVSSPENRHSPPPITSPPTWANGGRRGIPVSGTPPALRGPSSPLFLKSSHLPQPPAAPRIPPEASSQNRPIIPESPNGSGARMQHGYRSTPQIGVT